MKKKHVVIAKAYDRKGKFISVGFNDYIKSHPMQKLFAQQVGLEVKDKLHAEILCLIRAKEKQVYRLTVERYDSQGNMVLAKPCCICRKAIETYGVKQVEYTSSNGWIKE